jgi:hypothetical protein
MSLVPVIETLIGTASSPAGEVILYAVTAVLCMAVIKEFTALIRLLVKVIGKMA